MKEHRSTILLSIGILLIIIVVPLTLTLPACIERFNYSSTGAIGDTIGGLTAPFINGLGAILVFIAFREQVKANRLLAGRDLERDILDQIRSIDENKNDQYPFEQTVAGIINRADQMTYPTPDLTVTILLDRALYFLTEFVLAKELIERYSGNNTFLYKKLGYLYTIKYYAHIEKLRSSLEPRLGLENNNHDDVIFEVLTTTEQLNKYFDTIIEKYNKKEVKK